MLSSQYADDTQLYTPLNTDDAVRAINDSFQSVHWLDANGLRLNLDNITVWTVVQAVITATFNSYMDRQISTPYKINTPEPINKKIGTVDYVREGTLYTKFDTNPPTGGFGQMGEI